MIKLAKHNRLAVYVDVWQARSALQALDREKVGRVSIIGRYIEAAKTELQVDDLYLPQHVDWSKRRIRGALRGMVVGIPASMMVVGMIAASGGESNMLAALFRTGGIGALAGASGGVIVAQCLALDINREFRTAARWVEEGMVVVGVHCDNEEDVERARDVLWANDPLRIDRVDRTGRLVSVEYMAQLRRL